MRILNGLLSIILVLFAAAQYNDPDALLWGVIYGIAALWCGIAALRPRLLRHGLLRGLWALCAMAGLAGVIWYWPGTPNWWVREVWWETETAREGIGMMIVFAALLVAGLRTVLRRPLG